MAPCCSIYIHIDRERRKTGKEVNIDRATLIKLRSFSCQASF